MFPGYQALHSLPFLALPKLSKGVSINADYTTEILIRQCFHASNVQLAYWGCWLFFTPIVITPIVIKTTKLCNN